MSRFSRTALWRVDLLMSRCLVSCESFFDCTVRVAGPLYVLIASGLICCVVYIFFAIVLPFSYDLRSGWGAFHAVLATWITVNIFFNYFHCVRTNPGNPPDVVDADAETLESLKSEPEIEKGKGFSRWCKRCKKVKPPLTHHCHVCRNCILRMDHHCPWMHNCIGYYNYKYFFLFLFYMWLGCGYAAVMSAAPLFGQSADDDPASSIIFSFVLSLAVCGALTFLLGWHIYLVCSGQTTIEFYGNRFKKIDARKRGEVWVNEYDLGPQRNCMMTFGVSGRLWWMMIFFPWWSKPPRGDGRGPPNLMRTSPSSTVPTNTFAPSASDHHVVLVNEIEGRAQGQQTHVAGMDNKSLGCTVRGGVGSGDAGDSGNTNHNAM